MSMVSRAWTRRARSAARRSARAVAPAVTLAVALIAGASAAAAAGSCLRPPVQAPITRHFDAPMCPWCAGHRGLTYATAPGTPVLAASPGEVTFSGVVVDVRYVVVRHADGLLATYGGLTSSGLAAGDRVATGSVIGWSGPTLYFGLRAGPDEYVDPEPRLGELVVAPYLVPVDGTASRPPPPPRLRC